MINEQIAEYQKALAINPEDANAEYFLERAMAIFRRLYQR
jgi:hypothetical protein